MPDNLDVFRNFVNSLPDPVPDTPSAYAPPAPLTFDTPPVGMATTLHDDHLREEIYRLLHVHYRETHGRGLTAARIAFDLALANDGPRIRRLLGGLRDNGRVLQRGDGTWITAR